MTDLKQISRTACMAGCLLAAGLAYAQDSTGAGMLGLVDDVRQLQQEVRQLRGEVERLQYEADQSKLRQRDMFLDIEKRLSAIEKQGQAAGSAPAAVPSATPGLQPGQTAPVVIRPPEDIADTPGAEPGTPAQPADPATQAPAPVENEQDAYLKAFETLKQGRYDDSITSFQGFLDQFPEGAYADNARYWLAETYYVKKDFATSLVHFEKLLVDHPDSSKLPGALLKIGYIQYELGNNAEARLSLERVRNEFSGSNVADLASQRLERMDREGR